MTMMKRLLCGLSLLVVGASLAQAQTPIRFQLDWRFEGPSALFLLAAAKGYFAEEGLDVTIDSGSGSAGAINRVASGAYDMGFGDVNALVEFLANNPDAPAVQAVYVVYDGTPAAVFTLADSGIAEPADLAGKTLGAPTFDTGYRAWPIFANVNGVDPDSVIWQAMEPALRETMLVRGEVDAITGFYFTSLLNLEARGVSVDDMVIMLYSDYGVELYGNAIIASKAMLETNPEAVTAFTRAFNRALVETIKDPATAVGYVKRRDGLIDEPLELRRLQLALDAQIVTDETRAEGLGAVTMDRLSASIDEAVSSFGLSSTPAAATLFNTALLPDRDLRSVPEL